MTQTEHMAIDQHTQEVDGVDPTDLPATTDKKEIVTKPQKGIGLDSKGLLLPADSTEAWRVAKILLDSEAVPKQFRNVAQVFVATQFLREHAIPAMTGLRQCAIINGVLSIWGDLPKACVDRSGKLVSFDEILFDKDYKTICYENKNLKDEPWGAACTVTRKDKEPLTRSFTIDEANKAGLLSKANSVWKFYPRRMLQMRARSLALKDAFPDVLAGVAINEYDHPDSQVDVNPDHKVNVADALNKEFLTGTPVGDSA